MTRPVRPRVHLLDVNVLVALFDSGHVHHDAAHAWFGEVGRSAWATCPLTENGFVRVVSNPAYAGRRTTTSDGVDKLRTLTRAGGHSFWSDSVSILDAGRVAHGALHGHAHITDAYLLALAVEHGGALATFDRRIRMAAVRAAEARHLSVLPA